MTTFSKFILRIYGFSAIFSFVGGTYILFTTHDPICAVPFIMSLMCMFMFYVTIIQYKK